MNIKKYFCKHKQAYHFHENANPYCADCNSYPKVAGFYNIEIWWMLFKTRTRRTKWN